MMNGFSQSAIDKIIEYAFCNCLYVAGIISKPTNQNVTACTKQPPDLCSRVAMVNVQSSPRLRAANSALTVLLLDHVVVLLQRYSVESFVITVAKRSFVSLGLFPCFSDMWIVLMVPLLKMTSARFALPSVSIFVSRSFREVTQRKPFTAAGTLFRIRNRHGSLHDRFIVVRTAGRDQPSGCSHCTTGA